MACGWSPAGAKDWWSRNGLPECVMISKRAWWTMDPVDASNRTFYQLRAANPNPRARAYLAGDSPVDESRLVMSEIQGAGSAKLRFCPDFAWKVTIPTSWAEVLKRPPPLEPGETAAEVWMIAPLLVSRRAEMSPSESVSSRPCGAPIA